MKKTIAFILCMIIALSVAACGKKTEQEKSVYQIGETVTLKNWELTVTDVSFTDEKEDSGEKRVKVYCTGKNIGKKEATFFKSGIIFRKADEPKLLYGNGYEYEAAYVLFDENDLRNQKVIPLSSVSGYIQFIVPEAVADSQEELIFRFSCGRDQAFFRLR